MSVAVANEFVQNAERPGANRGELMVETSALQDVQQNGTRDCPHFAHPSGRSKRDVPMSQNDNAFSGRSPSGWHADAAGRDAGHDEMQAAVLRHFRSGEPQRIDWKRPHKEKRPYFSRYAWAEFAFTGYRGRLSGFADIAVRFETEESELDYYKRKFHNNNGSSTPYVYEPEKLWVFLELKPRIFSVGAVIRQCKATEVVGLAHSREWNFEVWPVVYDDDPKLALLDEMYDGFVLPWPRPVAEVLS